MNRTTYANASGLPNPRQITTAKDQATLGLRLMRDFPQYYPYFRLTSFSFQGRDIRGHNRLVSKFQGTDGIKTGYINASGFNLVSSVRRGDRRLVGVVLGGRTAARRDAYMMQMLTNAFPKAKNGSTIAAVVGSSKGAIDPLKNLTKKADGSDPTAVPNLNDDDKDGLAAAAADAAGTDEEEAEAQGSNNTTVIEATMDDDQAAAPGKPAKLPFAVKKPKTQADVDAMAVSSVSPPWTVEIGDFTTKQSAEQIARKLVAQDIDSKTVPLQRNGKTIYRLLVSGFDEMAAKRSCAQVAKLGKDCAVLGPQG